jgi:hypothetical protein
MRPNGASDGLRRPAPCSQRHPNRPVRRDRPRPAASGAGRSSPVAAALAVAVAVAVVVLSDRQTLDPREPAGPITTATSSDAAVSVRDGADPQDSGCAADPDTITLQSHEVGVAGVPVGLIELRYSPRCGVSWGRFTPAPAAPPITQRGPHTIHVLVVREESPPRIEPFALRYTGLPVFGNVLNSTRVCVRAEAYFSGPWWREQPSRTGCYRGRTPVHP